MDGEQPPSLPLSGANNEGGSETDRGRPKRRSAEDARPSDADERARPNARSRSEQQPERHIDCSEATTNNVDGNANDATNDDCSADEAPPAYLCCPVSHDLIEYPVAFGCGHTFDKKSIVALFRGDGRNKHLCPTCRKHIRNTRLVPIYALKDAIESYNKERGVNPTDSVNACAPEANLVDANGKAVLPCFKLATFSGVPAYYEGDLDRDGKGHGNGTLHFIDGKVYTGAFRGGEYHGEGVFSYANGDEYVGEFRHGKEEGRGVYTSADGWKYDGDWKDGKKHGHGVETFPNGESYVGEYRNNKKEGRGLYTHADGHKYDGEWKDGMEHGCGVYTWPNGDAYEGEFCNGKSEGKGVYTHTDGGSYDGEWKNDMKHGRGIQKAADGTTLSGIFHKGEYQGTD